MAEDVQDTVALDWRREEGKFTITMTYRAAEIVLTDTQTDDEDDQPSDMELLLQMVPQAIDVVMEQAYPNHLKELADG